MNLIKKSFYSVVFRSDFKNAKVIPLHKEKLKADENNYQPICLRLVRSKIFERVMFKRVYAYFENIDLFFFVINSVFGKST